MRFILILTLLTSALSLFSQAEEGQRSVNIRLLCFHGSAESLVNLGAEGEAIECKLVENIITRPIPLMAINNKITFRSAEDNTIVASVNITQQTSSAILIFIANNKATDSYKWRIYPIDDSPENFPPGGAYVANFHNQEIRCIIGEHKVLISPGNSKSLRRPAERNKYNMAAVAFQFLLKDKWVTAKESSARFTSKKRHLLISYFDQKSGRPRVSTHQIFAYPAPKS